MKRIQASLVLLLAVVVSIGLLSSAAVAESIINIHFEGLKFHYSDPNPGDLDGAILDSDSSPAANNTTRGMDGGFGVVSDFATPLTAVQLFQDQVPAGTIANAFADMHVGGVPDILSNASGNYSTSQSGAFGLDLITWDGTTADPVLQLNLNSFEVSYLRFPIGGSQVVSIVAGGGTNAILSQNLPDGRVIDTTKPITISLTSAALSSVLSSGGRIVSFDAFGTGDINATLVPEPGTLVGLAGMAVVGLVFAGLRRRRAA